MSKIKPGKLKPIGKIKNKTTIPEGLLRFSFKYLDLIGNEKFSLVHCKDGYLEKFLVRLRDVSAMQALHFRADNTKSLRSHGIDWSETTEKNGFTCLNEQLRDEQGWQFEISKDFHGRIHGIFLDDTFYIVWLDPAHKLYE